MAEPTVPQLRVRLGMAGREISRLSLRPAFGARPEVVQAVKQIEDAVSVLYSAVEGKH